jgi:hypothetical protein
VERRRQRQMCIRDRNNTNRITGKILGEFTTSGFSWYQNKRPKELHFSK